MLIEETIDFLIIDTVNELFFEGIMLDRRLAFFIVSQTFATKIEI